VQKLDKDKCNIRLKDKNKNIKNERIKNKNYTPHIVILCIHKYIHNTKN